MSRECKKAELEEKLAILYSQIIYAPDPNGMEHKRMKRRYHELNEEYSRISGNNFVLEEFVNRETSAFGECNI